MNQRMTSTEIKATWKRAHQLMVHEQWVEAEPLWRALTRVNGQPEVVSTQHKNTGQTASSTAGTRGTRGTNSTSPNLQSASPNSRPATSPNLQPVNPNSRPATSPVVWTELGRCCLQLGQLRQAEASLKRALQFQADYYPAHKMLGYLAMEQQQWAQAARQWQGALSQELNSAEQAEALHALIVTYSELGKFDEAKQLLHRLRTASAEPEEQRKFNIAALELEATLAAKQFDDDGIRVARETLAQYYPTAARTSLGYLGFLGSTDATSPDEHSSAAAPNQSAAPNLLPDELVQPAPPPAAAPDQSAAPNLLPDELVQPAPAPAAAPGQSAAAKLRSGWSVPPDHSPGRGLPTELWQAADATAAGRVLAYLEWQLPRSDYLSLARQAADKFPAAATLQADYIQRLTYDLTCPYELQEVQTRTAAFCERFPNHPRGWRLQANVAIAGNDAATVARLADRTGLADLQLWLAVHAGDHQLAHRLARQLRTNRYEPGTDNYRLDLRALTPPPPRALRDQIILFSAVRNEQEFLPWFFNYYRELGVDWFFMVDNLSTDNTTELLTAQPTTTVYASTDLHRVSVDGTRWVNELMRRHGKDNWCIFVDADEQLIVPDVKGGLRQLLDGMAARGEEVLPAFALDTYPESLSALQQFQPGDAPLTFSRMIDPDHYFFGKQENCFFKVRGGVRERLFGNREAMEQAPILRGGDHRHYQLSKHTTSYARVGHQFAVLLHHKLLREALERRTATASTWRIAGRRRERRQFHHRYHHSGLLDRHAEIPRGLRDFPYQHPIQLQHRGLLGEVQLQAPA